MLVGVGDGVAHPSSLVFVFRLVRLQQRDVALHLRVGRVHIAEDLGAGGLGQLLVAANVDLGALFSRPGYGRRCAAEC